MRPRGERQGEEEAFVRRVDSRVREVLTNVRVWR